MTTHRWWEVIVVVLMVGFFLVRLDSPLHANSLTPAASMNTPRVIALTFDDGPSPVYTPEILALLTRYQAHATFFVLGSEVAQWPNIARDIIKQGSVIANHGYRHVNYFRVGTDGVYQDAQRSAALLKKEHIPMVPFYRPPYGNSNARLVKFLSAKGYTVTLWNIDTRDWSEPGTSHITQKILTDAEPGAIVLMHDSGGRRQETVQALAAILPFLESEGYRFVTLPQYVEDFHLQHPAQLPLPTTTPKDSEKSTTAAGPWL